MRITAVLEDPELAWLKIGLNEMGFQHAKLSVHSTDLEALQAIYMEGRPELFILDLDMPGVIGLETVRAMRQQKELEGMPLILAASEDVALSPRAAARTQSVLKPVRPEDWSSVIRAALAAGPPTPVLAAEPPVVQQPHPRPERAPRKSNRKSLETPCLVSATGTKVKGILRDISLTGAKIALPGELKVNSMATLILGVPGTVPLKIVQIKTRVVRRTPDGYGIAFMEMDQDTRSLVLAVTQK